MPNDIVKQGYVQVKSKHLGTWNKRWLKLRNETSGKAKRLEKYSDEAAARTQGSERTTYELNSIHYVGRLSDSKKKHAIRMIMEDSSSVQFAADSEMEADNWLTAIQELKSGSLGTSKKSMFEVYLLKSSALDASGECLLEVRADCICLLDIDNHKRVQLTWPFSSIRKYSTERGLFRIETGRSSPTGEGQFMFDCRCADDIHDSVQAAVASMAMAKKQQPPSPAPAPAPAPAYEAERAYHSSMTSSMVKKNHYDTSPRYPAQPVKVHAVSTRTAACPPNGSGSNAYGLERDPYNSPPHPVGYSGVSRESWQQDDVDEAYYTAGQQSIKRRRRSSRDSRTSPVRCSVKDTPPPYTAPAPPVKGRGRSRDNMIPEVKVNKQSTRAAASPPNGSGSDACGPERRGQSCNTSVPGESWQQDDVDEAYYTAGQEPITFHGSTIKGSLKNQAQPVNYKEANPHYGSGNADSWQRDENDNDGEYYTAGPSLPPRRQGSTSSSSHVTDRLCPQRRQGSTSSSSHVTNQAMTDNVRTAVKCDRSTSMHVKTSVKDEDDRSLEYALKEVFDGTDLHMSRAVDRIEIDELDQWLHKNN